MLQKNNTAFILVDVQGKLSKVVHESDDLIKNLQILIKGLQVLKIPIILVEQYPEGLGRTNEAVAKHLTRLKPIEKRTFSACKNEQFMNEINKLDRKQLLIAGIEAHVCVYQTAMDLKKRGYNVQIVADAVSSRKLINKKIALEKMNRAGIELTSVEMALFELMETSEGDSFKKIIQYIK